VLDDVSHPGGLSARQREPNRLDLGIVRVGRGKQWHHRRGLEQKEFIVQQGNIAPRFH
jgi:hypothetical protein